MRCREWEESQREVAVPPSSTFHYTKPSHSNTLQEEEYTDERNNSKQTHMIKACLLSPLFFSFISLWTAVALSSSSVLLFLCIQCFNNKTRCWMKTEKKYKVLFCSISECFVGFFFFVFVLFCLFIFFDNRMTTSLVDTSPYSPCLHRHYRY